MVKLKYANNPDKLQSELKELNKVHVDDKNLHENKNDFLGDYTGEFEMIGKLSFCDQIRTTHIRFRNITDYEAYTKSFDEIYDAEDAVLYGYL